MTRTMVTRRHFYNPVGTEYELTSLSRSEIGAYLGGTVDVGSVTFWFDGVKAPAAIVRGTRVGDNDYIVEVLNAGRMRLVKSRADDNPGHIYPLPVEAAAVLTYAAVPAACILSFESACAAIYEWAHDGEFTRNWVQLRP